MTQSLPLPWSVRSGPPRVSAPQVRGATPSAASRLRGWLPCLAAAALFAAAAPAWADYPNRPIKMVVGFSPGTSIDTIARALAADMHKSMGQPVIVEGRPGAGGNIATEFVARSEPDGYTLLGTAFQVTITPWTQRLKFDVAKDLQPVLQTAASSYALIVSNKTGVTNFEEFVAYVRKHSGDITYGTNGPGTGSHLGMAMLQKQVGFTARHIPYKGAPENQTAVMTGEVDMAIESAVSIPPHVKAGKMRAIAVIGPPEKALPGVPSINDFYPDFELEPWHGVFVRAGTPPAVVQRLAEEIRKSLSNPDTRNWFLERGYRLVPSTTEQFTAKVQADLVKYKKLVEENHLTPQ